TNSGDAAGFAEKSFLFGCAGNTYYRDLDRDGVGAVGSGTAINCAVPPGYAALGTDCDDGNPLVKPGAIEACNGADDNCNGQLDEGLTSTTTWPDQDKDGYGAANGTPQTGCTGTGNRAPNSLDCNDLDPALRPGATELCNFRDDDCDGQYDEGVYAKCGVGWCQRTGTSCDSASCTPAAPLTERCNRIDDDCNGKIDDGDLCGAGQVCMLGECIGGASLPSDAGAPDSGTGEPADSGTTLPPADAGVPATADPAPSRSCAAAPGLWPLAALLLLRSARARTRTGR
ncbi:MAG: repeat domain protein, partial [Myxococcaceae bacterium]|nr:repeat domain protein [Myxococcaceae bacterium]